MNRDGTIRCEFEVALTRMDQTRAGGPLWGTVSGVLEGKANPEQAKVAFDATGAKPFEGVAAEIDQNVLGWVNWAVNEVFRVWATDRDVVQLILHSEAGVPDFQALLKPHFDPWSLQIGNVTLNFKLDAAAIQGLPQPIQAQLMPAPDKVTLEHQFSGDIPPVEDPVTGHSMQVRCNVQATFIVAIETARSSLDVSGEMPLDRLEREALKKCEEWFWYGVKQSFYNWMFDPNKVHRRFVRDYTLIHPHVMELSQNGLSQVGAQVERAMVRYEAMDPDSAWALTSPGQSGGSPSVEGAKGVTPAMPATPSAPADASGSPGQHRITPASPVGRSGSDQAMAATIAAMSIDDLELPGFNTGGAGQELPTIEEAVWRHQKRVMKDFPGLDRSGCAEKIMEFLKADGYSFDDRKRISSIIGANPDNVTD